PPLRGAPGEVDRCCPVLPRKVAGTPGYRFSPRARRSFLPHLWPRRSKPIATRRGGSAGNDSSRTSSRGTLPFARLVSPARDTCSPAAVKASRAPPGRRAGKGRQPGERSEERRVGKEWQ